MMPQQLSGGPGVEVGSFMEFPPVGNGRESAAVDQALAEVEAAEEYGLDAVWLAELHGAPERSVLSAPMMLASAIGARTSRVKIGIAVQVLPLSHPLRLAEEAATVDQISHGRLTMASAAAASCAPTRITAFPTRRAASVSP